MLQRSARRWPKTVPGRVTRKRRLRIGGAHLCE